MSVLLLTTGDGLLLTNGVDHLLLSMDEPSGHPSCVEITLLIPDVEITLSSPSINLTLETC